MDIRSAIDMELLSSEAALGLHIAEHEDPAAAPYFEDMMFQYAAALGTMPIGWQTLIAGYAMAVVDNARKAVTA